MLAGGVAHATLAVEFQQPQQAGHTPREKPRWRRALAAIPDGCLMPLHALLLCVLLVAGVLPLFHYIVRANTSGGGRYPILCGLYPDTTWVQEPAGDGDYSFIPIHVDAPPGPPGARNISDPDGCRADFEVFADYSREYEELAESPWMSADLLFLSGMVESLSPQSRTATVRYSMVTSGSYTGPWNQINLPPGIVLSITFNGDSALEVKDGDSFGSFTVQRVTIPIQPEKDLSLYPYDRYKLQLQVILKFINMSDGNSTSFVPFVAALRVRSPAFSFVVPEGSTWTFLSTTGSTFAATFVAARTGITKGFSMFVFIAMWALSIFCVVQAADIVFWRRRPISLDVPAFSATLLFALPAVRQVQPGVPDVGAVIDVVGFFWNMVIQAIVCCVLLAAIYAQGKHELAHAREDKEKKAWREHVLWREFRVRNGLTIGAEGTRSHRSITSRELCDFVEGAGRVGAYNP